MVNETNNIFSTKPPEKRRGAPAHRGPLHRRHTRQEQGENDGACAALIQEAVKIQDPGLDPILEAVEKLRQTLWNYQEVARMGPIDPEYLQFKLGWVDPKFNRVVAYCLEHPETGVIRDHLGEIALTW